MVLGGGVFHDAILLSMDCDRLLENLGPGLLSGAFTPGEHPASITVAPDIFEVEQFTKPHTVAGNHFITDPALEVLLQTVVERAKKQAEAEP